MEAVSMNTLYNSNGKVNWFGWIVFSGTLFIIGYSIYQLVMSIRKNRREEDFQMKKLTELEMNLRELRGDKYQTVTTNGNINKHHN